MTATPAPPPAPTPTVLVVDDEPWNRTLVEAILEDVGYRMTAASDGVEALAAVERQLPDAVLLDVMMPRMDGFEVCRRLKGRRSTYYVPVVMLTALADVGSKVRGLEAGADDFLSKPINRIEVLTRLRALLRIRALRDELDTTETIMVSMVTALEGKDPRRRGHSLRVAALAGATAAELGVGEEERESVLWGALLHDIGKIGVPDEILERRADERTIGEGLLYRRHPRYGERILRPLASLADAVPIVRHHHERLDGSGYPDGLAGDAFTRAIEIVAAANLYDGRRAESGAAAAAATLTATAAEGTLRRATVDALLRVAAALPAEPPPVELLLPVPAPPTRGRVYLADDRPEMGELIAAWLEDAGYTVRVEHDGAALLAAIEEDPPDLVIVDVFMPGVGGEEVCRRLRAGRRYQYLPVILITAHDDVTGRDRALALGADDFLTMPFDRQELVARARSLLRLRSYHRDLEGNESVVLSLSGMLEAKDRYTNGHSERVAALAVRIAREMGLGAAFEETMRLGGLLHDVGKVAVPERLLHKPGPLDEAEKAVVMTHPTVGWEICKDLKAVAAALPSIRWHHERFDGSGYPDGLVGEAVPVAARVMGLADAYDALTSKRPYRDRMTPPTAVELLRRETSAGRWDPATFRALVALHSRDELDVGPRSGAGTTSGGAADVARGST